MSEVRPERGAPVHPPPLAVAVGDPAGVGPLVSVRAALECAEGDRIVLFGDAERLTAMAGAEPGGRWTRVRRVEADAVKTLELGEIGCVHVSDWDDAWVDRRGPTAEGGRAQLAVLDEATASVRSRATRALVTGPTSKDAIHHAGVPFVGQTEHLATAAGMAKDAVTMMFLGPRLRVALVTTHLAVRDVPDAIRAERVERTAVHAAEAVLRLAAAGDPAPRLVVTGLNPHAGERGMFGDEEACAIFPGIERARRQPPFAGGRAVLDGPLPAETAFRQAAEGAWQGVVTMMHDQATIASKLLDWSRAVNVTWGLPFVRTSVDHGVAYDAAARGEVEHAGMVAAMRMAQRLTAGGGSAS
ncbi:MAG: PdxA family dehydrogenase [Myxococcota bacterium]